MHTFTLENDPETFTTQHSSDLARNLANYPPMICSLHVEINVATCRKNSSILWLISLSHVTCSVCSTARLHHTLSAAVWSEMFCFLPKTINKQEAQYCKCPHEGH